VERKTKQRDAIWRAIETANRPLSPHEVLDLAKTSVPGLGIATVYRALNDFVEAGRLSPVELPGESARYEAHGKGHHHHFVCRTCNRVFEVETCPGTLNITPPRGFAVERHEVILHGLCPECRA
jgi:Fur family ferric uptake transcriptional regulator